MAKGTLCSQAKHPQLTFKRLDLLLGKLRTPGSSLLWVAAEAKAPITQTNVSDAREESRAWL